MKVREVASSSVVAVGPGHTLRQAAQVMHGRGVGSAVVSDSEQLVGILTERDVLNAVATGADPDEASVQDFMSSQLVTVGPDWEVTEAAAEMVHRKIRHLVIYTGGQLLGVLSVRDVLAALLPESART